MPCLSYHGGMVRLCDTQSKPGSDFVDDVKIPHPSQKSLILNRRNLYLLNEIKKVVKADNFRIYVQAIMCIWMTVIWRFSIFGRCLNEHKWFVVFFSAVVGTISLVEASALGKTTHQISKKEVPNKSDIY